MYIRFRDKSLMRFHIVTLSSKVFPVFTRLTDHMMKNKLTDKGIKVTLKLILNTPLFVISSILLNFHIKLSSG